MKRLEGKTALITGGGTGIGASVAQRFVAEGARVCISGRRQQCLDTLARLEPSGTVVTVAGDVTDEKDIERMLGTVVKLWGRLDVLVNNAGVSTVGRVADLDPDLWRQTFEVNVTAPFLLMKASIPHMIEACGGSIINIASVAGLRCIPDSPAYCASKAALIMLTKQAALDYGAYGIRCNTVCPGFVKTPMTEANFEKFATMVGSDRDTLIAEATKNLPLRRISVPEEIAGLCCYLASDDSSFMTGAILLIDGGAAVVDVGMVWRNDPRYSF